MTQISYTLTLTSDGEPAHGFGTGSIDALLPRDGRGRIIIPASHLKGIIRENLDGMLRDIVPLKAMTDLFGREGVDAEGGGLFHMDDAVAPGSAGVLVITRTALNRHGVAKDKSLRSGEAVARGTEFRGSLTCRPGLKPAFVELLKLGLLSLFAVGGGRNRGAGACFVTLDDEVRTPGQILTGLDRSAFAGEPLAPVAGTLPGSATGRRVLVKLTFRADGPVCVPDIPVVENNAISTGFAVPSSAVQGAVLHRLNDVDPALADACFKHGDFRAWPLHPDCGEAGISVRAPMTAKVIKPGRGGEPGGFYDDALAGDTPPDRPMKSVRGVMAAKEGQWELWRSGDMGRTISAHGVHNRYEKEEERKAKRNLFTVEALSPVTFTGLLTIPEDTWPVLEESLSQNPNAWFGKARTIRGGGRLGAVRMTADDLYRVFGWENRVFIVQSPVRIPGEFDLSAPAGEILEQIVSRSDMGSVQKAWASMGIRFGWSRKDSRGRIPPVPVILPGSVFRLEGPVEDWADVVAKGLGEGREQGFGAFMPHPGPITGLYSPEPVSPRVASSKTGYATQGFDLYGKVVKSGLSASQISRVRELALTGKGPALAFLDRQRTGRPDAIWDRWKPVIMEISQGIQKDSGHMAAVLKVCQDLMVAKGETR